MINSGDADRYGEPRIPTYLSHSYRPEDREINQFFHELSWKSGFAFTVDRRTGPVSTTRLEMMMRRSACFVGLVTRRNQPVYRCSPFAVYENGLAVQAHKPRLLLLEREVSGRHFPESRHTMVFDRHRLAAAAAEMEDRLMQLAIESRPYVNLDTRVLGRVGVLLPRDPVHGEATLTVKTVLHDAGYDPVDLDLRDLDSATAASLLDQLDFVVLDVGGTETPQLLIPFIQGRFVPSLKLIFYRPGKQPPPAIPRLLLDRALEAATTAREIALWWSDTAQLHTELTKRVEALSTPRWQFQHEEEGTSYFLGLGQTRGPVFVSNAGADNALARGVVDELRSYGIRSFHYVYQNSITPGVLWKPVLPQKVSECQVFVPLISPEYWKSSYCREEFDAALELHRQGKLVMIPCFLDPTDAQEVEVQGIQLTGLDLTPAAQVQRIVSEVDRVLLGDRGLRIEATAGARASSAPAPTQYDIAILTALPEEYEAVYQHLIDPERVISTNDLHNRYSWVTASIPSSNQGSYRVVLALAGKGTEAALLCARSTTDAFRPDSVLLVGVAGAVNGQLTPGDLVVSDRILGYEYGKIDAGFHPRPDLSFPTDQSIASAAATMPIRENGWIGSIRVAPPSGRHRPQVVIGPVASGNKVVDDLSDSTFASVLTLWPKLVAVEMEALGTVRAVEDARERGTISHFTTIRGISDCPMTCAAANAPAVTRSDAAWTVRPQPSRHSRQRDQWKPYAAAVAAAFTMTLIHTSWPRPPRTGLSGAGRDPNCP
jgi:nucleoside phosphorylase